MTDPQIAEIAERLSKAQREGPFSPIHQMNQAEWEAAIQNEMPWYAPETIRAAAVLMEQRYRKGNQ